VQLCANLVAKPSQMAGVPYAVISRQAFGVFGANIPAVIRGLIAFAWYGIQTYLAANALMLVALKFWPSLSALTTSAHSLACRIWAGSALPLCGCCRRWSSGTA
jgi:NCS1 family nucleobase:cation symporter-1